MYPLRLSKRSRSQFLDQKEKTCLGLNHEALNRISLSPIHSRKAYNTKSNLNVGAFSKYMTNACLGLILCQNGVYDQNPMHGSCNACVSRLGINDGVIF